MPAARKTPEPAKPEPTPSAPASYVGKVAAFAPTVTEFVEASRARIAEFAAAAAAINTNSAPEVGQERVPLHMRRVLSALGDLGRDLDAVQAMAADLTQAAAS